MERGYDGQATGARSRDDRVGGFTCAISGLAAILTCGPLIWINSLASDEEQTVLVTPEVLLSCSFE